MSDDEELRITKIFNFTDNCKNPESLSINIEEIIGTGHGLHVWPCSVVLAQFIWFNRKTEFKGKHVLEIGAGTSLPSVVAAKCASPKSVTITDNNTYTECLSMIKRSLSLNHLNDFVDFALYDGISDIGDKSIFITGITWGQITPQLLYLLQTKKWNLPHTILGSDCFYDEADFEHILATIYYLLSYKKEIDVNCDPGKFLCTYQTRSLTWSITHLLDKWDMFCEVIPLHSFNANTGNIADSEMPGVHSIQMLVIKLK